MRNRFASVFYELAKADELLCMVVADISPAGSIAQFRMEYPDRFINTGVAEQSMIGIAAGMALRGLRPFAYTIATFALYRPFEFIRDDLCYHNLPVTVVGIGGGVNYSALGGTHHAMEDIGIASSVPNMSVISPCDPEETEAAVQWCATQTRGPVYLRLGRAGEPTLTAEAEEDWEFGKLRAIQRGGTDVAVLSYGAVAAKAIDLAESLRSLGKGVSVFGCHTIKPLDVTGIQSVLRHHAQVIVVEETTPTGGLGGRVKEIGWDQQVACRIDTFGLKDSFIHCYGSHDDLLAAHGLEVPAMLDALAR